MCFVFAVRPFLAPPPCGFVFCARPHPPLDKPSLYRAPARVFRPAPRGGEPF